MVPEQLDVPCSDPLLFQAFSPARAPLRSQSNDAALLPCAAGDGVTGLALVEAVRMAESRLMLADKRRFVLITLLTVRSENIS